MGRDIYSVCNVSHNGHLESSLTGCGELGTYNNKNVTLTGCVGCVMSLIMDTYYPQSHLVVDLIHRVFSYCLLPLLYYYYSQVGPYVRLELGQERAFFIDSGPLSHAFVPCGHVTTQRTVE